MWLLSCDDKPGHTIHGVRCETVCRLLWSPGEPRGALLPRCGTRRPGARLGDHEHCVMMRFRYYCMQLGAVVGGTS